MKNIYLYVILILWLAGCGDSNSVVIYDDGNGTRSPRISKVYKVQYEDGNSTTNIEISYRYNTDNTLKEKKWVNSLGTKIHTLYRYNSLKQILEIRTSNENELFTGYATAYNYSDDLLDAKWKLPLLVSNEYASYFHGNVFVRTSFYEYMYNQNGEGDKILSSYNTQTVSLYAAGEVDVAPDTNTIYFYDDENRINKVITDGVETTYLYNEVGKLMQVLNNFSKIAYNYDNNLLLSKNYYQKTSLGEWQILESSRYIYENKKYFFKAPLPLAIQQMQ